MGCGMFSHWLLIQTVDDNEEDEEKGLSEEQHQQHRPVFVLSSVTYI